MIAIGNVSTVDHLTGRFNYHLRDACRSINKLTSLPDSVLSKCRRLRHAEFQHIKRQHH